jgi:hypothetical protein
MQNRTINPITIISIIPLSALSHPPGSLSVIATLASAGRQIPLNLSTARTGSIIIKIQTIIIVGCEIKIFIIKSKVDINSK